MLRTVIKVDFTLGLAASVEVMVIESAEKRLTVGDGDGDGDGGDPSSSTTGTRAMESVLREDDSPS